MSRTVRSHVFRPLVSLLAVLLTTAAPVQAGILGPYQVDAATLHLWHFDEAQVPLADAAQPPLPLQAAAAGAIVGVAGAPGFGSALSTLDGGHDGLAATDKDAYAASLTLVNGAGDNVNWSFSDPTTGAFTFEALLRLDFNPAANLGPAPGNGRNAPLQIITGDQDGVGGGVRSFQLRLDPVGFNPNAGTQTSPLTQPAIEFININNGANLQYIFALLPTTGPDAVQQGRWYHLAVTYNGAENTPENFRIFWTALDESRTEANEVVVTSLLADLPVGQIDFTIGNTGRSTPNNNFLGLIDEVRISSVPRRANEMVFGGVSVTNPPAITAAVGSFKVSPGAAVLFDVRASGTPPLAYQWFYNGTAIPNATNFSYGLTAVRGEDAGTYSVVVTNQAGSVSSSGTLTVQFPTPSELTYEPLGPSSRRSSVVLSEIMDHPAERADGLNSEFVELYNANPWSEDISGWRLSGDISYTFPEGTRMPAKGYLAVARRPADFLQVYGQTNVLGGFSNNIPNGSGLLRLRKKAGGVVFEVTYSDSAPWPVAADGTGHSLILARPSYGEANPRSWEASAFKGGSPGGPDPLPTNILNHVVINEVLAHTDPPALDFVELHNHSAVAVDLSGAWLSDSPVTNKFRIPDGNVLAPGGFIAFNETQLGFALSASGETVYLVNSNNTRVVDALRFGGQENGVAFGRVPDGGPQWRRLLNPTTGSTNAGVLSPAIVINEIYYDPITGDDRDEFVELYNRSSAAIDLTGWRFTSGINFSFAPGTSLAAGAYLVVASDRSRLLTNHPALSPASVVGNFGGSLANSGERLAIGFNDTSVSTNATNSAVLMTNTFHVTVEEVTYGTGGRWGRWAHGGGSSLERRDVHGDAADPANWADSDETAKSSWVTVEKTGRIDHGHPLTTSIDQLHIFLLDGGEALVDNVEVIPAGGGNVVANSTFESGTNGWFFYGTHRPSYWETNSGFQSAGSLHVVATERGDVANRIRTQLSPVLVSNSIVTLRARARWLRGHPELILRTVGSSLEAVGALPVPSNLGTPGAPNSRAVNNLGPAITDVTHRPVLPTSGQAIRVLARVHDVDGVAAVNLRYRIDPSTNRLSVPMRDDGAGGDLLAGDGIYTGVIPGQGSGSTVAFAVEATDRAGAPASSVYPALAPLREALVRVGDPVTGGDFATYRVWMTAANYNFWATRQKASAEAIDATFIYANARPIYGAEIVYGMSDNSTIFVDTPLTTVAGYEVHFPSDDPLLGATNIKLDYPEKDVTSLREPLINWMHEQLGLPNLHRRWVYVYLNGVRRGVLYHDAQRPNGDVVEEWWRNDDAGDLIKTDPYQEASAVGVYSNSRILLPSMELFWTTNGTNVELKIARYRNNFKPRNYSGSANNYTNFLRLIEAANAPAADYVRAVNSVVDMRNWMRTFAMADLVAFWDSFGNSNGKNTYLYKPQREGWQLIGWDFDVGLGQFRNDQTYAPLFDTGIDPTLIRMFNTPDFIRHYWTALDEGLRGFFNAGPGTEINRFLTERYSAFQSNNVVTTSPFAPSGDSALSIPDWISGRRAFIAPQIIGTTAAFAVTSPTNGASLETNLVQLTGTAPASVTRIAVNNRPLTLHWSTVTNWSASVLLAPGTNTLQVLATDAGGATSGVVQLTLIFTGEQSWPALRINEWMASNTGFIRDPADNDTDDWFELYNPTLGAVDLTGWFLSDTATNVTQFQIPAGYSIPAGGHLLVWADGEANQNSSNRIDLHVNFQLAKAGEAIVLSAPDGARVDYVTFGPQTNDVSEGRFPDGAAARVFFDAPTPRLANQRPTPAGPAALMASVQLSSGAPRSGSTPRWDGATVSSSRTT